MSDVNTEISNRRHQVVVVERDAPRAELGQPVHRLHRIDRRPRRVGERALPDPYFESFASSTMTGYA